MLSNIQLLADLSVTDRIIHADIYLYFRLAFTEYLFGSLTKQRLEGSLQRLKRFTSFMAQERPAI